MSFTDTDSSIFDPIDISSSFVILVSSDLLWWLETFGLKSFEVPPILSYFNYKLQVD